MSSVTSRPLASRTRSLLDAKHAAAEDAAVPSDSASVIMAIVSAARRLAESGERSPARSSGSGASNVSGAPVGRVGELSRAAWRNGRSSRASAARRGGTRRRVAAVERVADDRVSGLAEVHANLVRAPGADRDADE